MESHLFAVSWLLDLVTARAALGASSFMVWRLPG
jgi:hypothetical protein